MNLKSNIINNAIAGFINMFKSGSMSFIVKRLSAFLLSLIIFVSSVFCQYCTAVVSAAEVGAIVAVDLIAELAISGGIVAGIFRTVEIIQGEISSGYGFGSDSLDEYALKVNGLLTDQVNNGVITNEEAGTVNKVSGVPVEIICPIYGAYQFLCTNELCNKIMTERPSTEEGLKSIVNSYWSSVNILDQRTFEEIASDPHNWVSHLESLNTDGYNFMAETVFNTFGENISSPNEDFYTTGLYATYDWGTTTIRRYNLNFNPSLISQYNDFFIVRLTHFENNAHEPREWINLYAHSVTEVNPSLYIRVAGDNFGSDAFKGLFPNGFRTVTFSSSKALELGFGVNYFPPLDMSEVFPNWGSLWGIEATDGVDVLDWIYGDSRFWNTDVLDLAIDTIADAVDAKVETGSDAGAQDIPIELPIDIPIEGEGDVAWPSDGTDEDFDDPPAYPRTDEWADVDETDWPTFDPDPEDPDPEDPDPEDPDKPSGGDSPELPQLKIPVLLTLFPFCIPFDIKRSIEWFGDSGNSIGTNNNSVSEQYNTGVYNNMSSSEVEEINGNGMEPVFAIPLNIGVSGRPVLQSTVVLDLTEYGIPVLVEYIKTVQIIAWIIVLGVATYKFIY